ncbi:MAG: VacJ family lipoprotein [Desulfobacteraceae bacterium]|jgi:phospholipid-binding lipoprotein MlaA|nr:VacJ family lipoprotein [Desulfobacteraceae bacterium]
MKRAITLTLLIFLVLMAGCATAPVQKEPIIPARRSVEGYAIPETQQAFYAYDPWESMNRRIYNFNAVFDEYVFLPVVNAYEFVLPGFAQTGVSNFFNNLAEINNLMNSLLQFKMVKFFNTVGRVALNTTAGVGGLIDMATHAGVRRENEDFGQTLGFYGLGPGPYLVLPVLGPSNLRDTGGLVVDTVVYTLMMNELIDQLDMDDSDEDILKYSLTGLSAIDKRHKQSFRYFMTGSPFEYEFVRKLYKVQREFLIEN